MEEEKFLPEKQEGQPSKPKTLWLLIYEYRKIKADVFMTIYAENHEDAERQAEEIEKSTKTFKRRVMLKVCPSGFTIYHREVPGTKD